MATAPNSARLLLDTHAAAWWWLGNSRLPAAALGAIEAASEVFVSAVSVFEFATKYRFSKWPEVGTVLARLPILMETSRFKSLPVTAQHGQVAGGLMQSHRDPFDRLLVAQSQVEGLTIITADAAFVRFGVPLIWAGAAT